MVKLSTSDSGSGFTSPTEIPAIPKSYEIEEQEPVSSSAPPTIFEKASSEAQDHTMTIVIVLVLILALSIGAFAFYKLRGKQDKEPEIKADGD